ncbi:hypothetical protein CBR_g2844 [Chara braunii]|uniref:Uncharacterized protein n=1 Tax=Chara braunii TaxID=69332 RepID=A0A388KE12_CHABU|nr:hypothetical protein CBR_g2844 [Chara braunii]|eukprot:GBG68298.1 hypothetical protein CBR_g2844 [Chara braunii]
MTRRQVGKEMHTMTKELPGQCQNQYAPPCAGFVEIMAPVFSRAAWRCVWYLIQNDLVHGWGLDMVLGKCVQWPPYQRIGVIDAQWVTHLRIPSLGNQGEKHDPKKEAWKEEEEEKMAAILQEKKEKKEAKKKALKEEHAAKLKKMEEEMAREKEKLKKEEEEKMKEVDEEEEGPPLQKSGQHNIWPQLP